MPQKEMGVIPGSPLAKLLARLERHDRRLLLAAVQAAPGPRREKLQREIRKRLFELGIE
jgi:hypothetical protein